MVLNDAVLYFSLDDADLSGVTLTDLGSGSNNGTNNGATTGVSAVVAEGFSFDGTNDYVSTSNWAPPASTSVCFWMKRGETVGTALDIIVGWESGNAYYKIGLQDHKITVGVRNTAGNHRWWNETTTITDTDWHYIVVTQVGVATPIIYIDNVSTTVAIMFQSGSPVRPSSSLVFNIGRRPGCTEYFNGSMDETAIYNRIITGVSGEVATLYNSGSGFNPYASVGGNTKQINIGDSWKDIDAIKINIGDSWKVVSSVKINIGDSWKTLF